MMDRRNYRLFVILAVLLITIANIGQVHTDNLNRAESVKRQSRSTGFRCYRRNPRTRFPEDVLDYPSSYVSSDFRSFHNSYDVYPPSYGNYFPYFRAGGGRGGAGGFDGGGGGGVGGGHGGGGGWGGR